MKTVAVVVFPGVQSLDIAGPLDVFAEANRFVQAGSGYRLVMIGTAPYPIMASNGMPLGAELSIEDAPHEHAAGIQPAAGRDADPVPRTLSAQWVSAEARSRISVCPWIYGCHGAPRQGSCCGWICPTSCNTVLPAFSPE
jgi:transcriptional regulator GlxA family with amidase domain